MQNSIYAIITAALLTLTLAPALAQEGVLDDPDKILLQVEASWRCDLLGKPTPKGNDKMPYDKHGVKCPNGSTANIRPLVWGFQDGLIERLKTAGLPVEKWRSELADPVKLKKFQDKWTTPINSMAITYFLGMDAEIVNSLILTDEAKLSKWSERKIRGFISRRMSEAKPSDRLEIATIWSGIIADQIKRFMSHKNPMDELFKTE